MLNTDTTPGSFWITHPNNIFKGNHAAGSDRYGFWFDLKDTSTGPSYDPNICPIYSPLGEFSNNYAHTNGRYGLRVFHGHIPRLNPCFPIIYDETNTTDPYWQNPLYTTVYENFTGWSNHLSGAIFERVGDIHLIGFKVAEYTESGIEVSVVEPGIMTNLPKIDNAFVVGYTQGNA